MCSGFFLATITSKNETLFLYVETKLETKKPHSFIRLFFFIAKINDSQYLPDVIR